MSSHESSIQNKIWPTGGFHKYYLLIFILLSPTQEAGMLLDASI